MSCYPQWGRLHSSTSINMYPRHAPGASEAHIYTTIYLSIYTVGVGVMKSSTVMKDLDSGTTSVGDCAGKNRSMRAAITNACMQEPKPFDSVELTEQIENIRF